MSAMSAQFFNRARWNLPLLAFGWLFFSCSLPDAWASFSNFNRHPDLDELTSVTRSDSLTLAGRTSIPATQVTVSDNGNSAVNAQLYGDDTFARSGIKLVDGNNSFTATATDDYGRTDAQTINVSAPATVNFSYDGNGNLAGDGRRVFEYDDENQLAAVYVPGSWRTEFVYDGLRRMRIRKEMAWNGTAWGLLSETRYIYDGFRVVQERDGSNTPLATYARGLDLSGTLEGTGGIGGLLSMSDANGDFFYHADGSGNITALMRSDEAIVARYHYDPFGNMLGMSGYMAGVNRFRFSSKELHESSGLYYFGYRFFDTSLQRWINQDPIGEEGGVNLYGFALNDPVNLIDSDGLTASPYFNPTGVVVVEPDGNLRSVPFSPEDRAENLELCLNVFEFFVPISAIAALAEGSAGPAAAEFALNKTRPLKTLDQLPGFDTLTPILPTVA